MITIVDRNADRIVQKVVRPRKTPVYQVVVKDHIGDSSRVVLCSTLVEARALIGKSQGGKPLGSRIASNG